MLSLPDDLENRTGKPSAPVQLLPSRGLEMREPSGYEPGPELVDALRVALLLRKPLLVTGEPGTGKTDLGRYLAWKCGFLLFQFEAKSSSQSRDLYYTYDSLARFQAAQGGDKTEPRHFIHFNALGEAILQSSELSEPLQKILPPDFLPQGPRQSVVVIDEIDKAPRDFPNDLLNELDQSFFRIPELGNVRVDAKSGLEPVLVITSNSEKNLPAPFLRRCAYYHIPFPAPKQLRAIVSARIQEFRGNSALLEDALDLFGTFRGKSSPLSKPPATAELLDWLVALLATNTKRDRSLRTQEDKLYASLTALIKHEADLEPARSMAKNWVNSPKSSTSGAGG